MLCGFDEGSHLFGRWFHVLDRRTSIFEMLRFRGTALKDADERVKLQFEYAWRWFDSHAKQRMMMFYYYLVMVGILANAWVLSYDKGYSAVAVAISLMGVLASVSAVCFDVRNRQMSKAAEDILESLETAEIYVATPDDEGSKQMGPLSTDRRLGMREGQKLTLKNWLLKHKFWIRLIEGSFALAFLLAIALALCWPTR